MAMSRTLGLNMSIIYLVRIVPEYAAVSMTYARCMLFSWKDASSAELSLS